VAFFRFFARFHIEEIVEQKLNIVKVYIRSVSDPAPGPAVRNKPRQARSRARVERLLDAAEAILAESGYDALNTNAVAAQAKTSVGTLYHYFPDKAAILGALIARYNEGYVEVLERLHKDLPPDLEIERYIDRVRRALNDFDHAHPGQGVAFHHALSELSGFQATNKTTTDTIVEIFAAYFQRRMPTLSAERAALIARAIITVYEGLSFAVSGKETAAPGTVVPGLEGEMQTMIVVYLKQALANGKRL